MLNKILFVSATFVGSGMADPTGRAKDLAVTPTDRCIMRHVTQADNKMSTSRRHRNNSKRTRADR